MLQPETPRTSRDQPVWLDLGCGTSKQAGFIGVDRFPMPGVNIVCNLDDGIPIASDSVDYLLASHSLEHLRDLPAAMTEVYRVCKDRAVVTIIAPYDATRLNQANPYHVQPWNEHTPRFFTAAGTPDIDPAEYRFPAAGHWGLQASDFTQSAVDMRCLRMEFTYLPPYRSLDEMTKRTLRQSLSDVCDQMALHLLVVKSSIDDAELTRRASAIQYPLPSAYAARREAETEIGEQNLFSELATIPERFTRQSVKINEEVALLGNEMRRFIQRVDHLDRTLVTEQRETALLGDEMRNFIGRVDHIEQSLVSAVAKTHRELLEMVNAGRVLSERMTAVNSALTRRMQTMNDELSDALETQLRTEQSKSSEPILRHLVAERRARSDTAFWPLRFLRRFRQRGFDLRTAVGGSLQRLWEGPEVPTGPFRLQLGTFFIAHATRIYPLMTTGTPLRGIEIGVSATFAPTEPAVICDYALCDGGGSPLRSGTVSIDWPCNSAPVAITFEPIACTTGQSFILKLTPVASAERIGVQLFEWHRVTPVLRRVPELRLAYRAQYEA